MTEKREQWTLQKREAGNEKRMELEEKLKEKHVQEVLQMKVHCLGEQFRDLVGYKLVYYMILYCNFMDASFIYCSKAAHSAPQHDSLSVAVVLTQHCSSMCEIPYSL